jgi:DNA processing protein
MSSKILSQNIKEFEDLKQKVQTLYYRGDTSLLQKPKISIVGTRRPNSYSKEYTYKISKAFSNLGYAIVSGGAMGVDAIALTSAAQTNTIAVLANGLDIKYPAVNKELLNNIENNGLLLSEYEDGQKARNYTFVHRNRLVVALGEILIVTEADIDSGSLRSVEYAKELGKEIFVLPHRLHESLGTNNLIRTGIAKPIYDLDLFLGRFEEVKKISDTKDEFLEYCYNNSSYEEVCKKYAQEVFEYELSGKIIVENGVIKVV